jgi:hypothetical protein
VCQISFENLEGRDHLVVLGVDGRIILKWILCCGVRTWIEMK